MPRIPASRSASRDLYDFPTTPSWVQELSQPQKEEPGGRGRDRQVFAMLTEASLTHTFQLRKNRKLEPKFRTPEYWGKSPENSCGDGVNNEE